MYCRVFRACKVSILYEYTCAAQIRPFISRLRRDTTTTRHTRHSTYEYMYEYRKDCVFKQSSFIFFNEE